MGEESPGGRESSAPTGAFKVQALTASLPERQGIRGCHMGSLSVDQVQDLEINRERV